MRKILNLLILFIVVIIVNGCATIFGGARYNAHISVVGHPNSSIYYQGEKKGNGKATFLVKRAQSDKLKITIKEAGCPDYTHKYDSKVPRLGAVLGTASEVAQMILSQTIVIPLGSIIDFSTGAYWKPNVLNIDINKIDYDNFKYILDYPGCDEPDK